MSTPAPAAPASVEGFSFTGSGREYFGIWIVNLLLTLLTLGLYSPWAKVRRMQYFYRHTQLAGAGFDYHGDPVAILKGRLIALGLFLIYNLSFEVSGLTGVIGLLFLGAMLPWLLRSSLRFRLKNSSYRGLRFRFTGDMKGAFETFLVLPIAALVTLNLAWPWAHHRLKDYQHNHSRYGTTAFAFDASIGSFYKEYMLIGLLGLAALVVPVVIAVMLAANTAGAAAPPAPGAPNPAVAAGIFAVMAGFIVGMLMIAPVFQARIQNLVWNHTTLGPHRFSSAVSAWRLAGVQLGNLLLIVLTLGFFTPWAAVRLARCRVDALSLATAGSLDAFVADQEPEVGAIGEEAADLFDIDIAL